MTILQFLKLELLMTVGIILFAYVPAITLYLIDDWRWQYRQWRHRSRVNSTMPDSGHPYR